MKASELRVVLVIVGVPVVLSLAFGSSLWPVLAAALAWFVLIGWGWRQEMRDPLSQRARLAPLLLMLFMFLGLPTALASLIATGWKTVALAYAIWFGMLGLWALQGLSARGVTSGEAVGWPMIFGMLLTWIVVPLVTLILRLAGWSA